MFQILIWTGMKHFTTFPINLADPELLTIVNRYVIVLDIQFGGI